MKHPSEDTPHALELVLLDVNGVARRLGVSRHTIYSWVSQRRIPYLKVGRLLRFDLGAITAWLQEESREPLDLESSPSSPHDAERCGTRLRERR